MNNTAPGHGITSQISFPPEASLSVLWWIPPAEEKFGSVSASDPPVEDRLQCSGKIVEY